jgi:hypothetical protein
MSFNKNMDLHLAVHRAFALETSPKIMTLMRIFLGQPIHRICCLVISFYGAIGKGECFRHTQQTYTVSKLRISEE